MIRTYSTGRVLGGLSLALALVVGCQTQVPGTLQTLPSPRYLQHPPQYIPPSPPFPLARELAAQEKAWAEPVPTALGEVPPRPVPIGPAPGAPPGVIPPPGGP